MFNYYLAAALFERYKETESRYFDGRDTEQGDALESAMNDLKAELAWELSAIYPTESGRTIKTKIDALRRQVSEDMEKAHKKQLEQFGAVSYNGQNYELTHEAYFSGKHYTANAIGTDGKEYLVKWEIVRPDAEEESDMCNWDLPEEIAEI